MKPFLKWVGSKRRLVPELLKRLPAKFDRYFEPFLGSGAMFLALAERFQHANQVFLADASIDLANAWTFAEPALITKYGRGILDVETYRLHRSAYNSGILTPKQQASLFVALNHTCFNGLWRVDSRGRFNVPFGDRFGNKAPDWDVISAEADRAINRTSKIVQCMSFEQTMMRAYAGDFVYCDPPYYSTHSAYTKGGFNLEAHRDLRACADDAHKRGAHVMVSLGNHPEMHRIWDGWRVEELRISHSVGASGSTRAPKTELLARNW